MARTRQPQRSPVVVIFMIAFVDVLGLGVTLPVLPLYAQQELGASATQVALLASLYFAAQFMAAPRLGRLSDRIGRRPVLIASQLGTLAALLLSGAAASLPLLYLARVLDGMTGGNISVAQAYLVDLSDERDRTRSLGVINASSGAGLLFGPVFGSLISAQWGPRAAFFAAASISALTIALSFFLLPEPPRRQPRPPAAEAHPAAAPAPSGALSEVRPLLALAFVGQVSFFSFQSTFVLWVERMLLAGGDAGLTQKAVGGLLTLAGASRLATQVWLVGPLVRRFGETAMMAGGMVLRGMAWATMALLPSMAAVVLAMPVLAMGTGVYAPALAALTTYAVPREQHGYAMGLLESSQALGRIAGPLVAGVLFQHLDPNAPMWLAALLSGLMLVGARHLRRAGGPRTSLSPGGLS